MTDPEMADRTYIEPITPEVVEQIIAVERPDAVLPTLGGQTGLNVGLALAESGVLEQLRLPAHRRQRRGDPQGRGPRPVQAVHGRDRPGERPQRPGPQPRRGPRRSATRSACPASCGPSFTLGGSGGGIAYNREEFDRMVAYGLELSPVALDPRRGERHRLERVRDGGDARLRRQRRDRLLDRELRPDGRPHRRQHHRRPRADAHRQGIPADARRLARDPPQDRRRDRRLERPVRRSTRRTAG